MRDCTRQIEASTVYSEESYPTSNALFHGSYTEDGRRSFRRGESFPFVTGEASAFPRVEAVAAVRSSHQRRIFGTVSSAGRLDAAACPQGCYTRVSLVICRSSALCTHI